MTIIPGHAARGRIRSSPLGNPNVSQVFSDGWRVTYSNPPAEFNPTGDPKTIAVQRNGFNASGQAIVVEDVLTVMKRVRQPHPNQNTLTATEALLSDFVYVGDTIAGTTNNSTKVYPRPMGMWLDHDLKRVTGQSYTARLALAHAFARNGRPVAAVKFTATDGTTTVEQLVSTMSTITYSRTGLTVPHFAATLNFSTLANNVMITIDAVIYPWFGPAYTISVDGAAYPSASLTVLKVLNDVSYGTAYAYVSPSGNNGTGVVSTTAGTAQASPFLTVASAATSLQTYNNTNFSRNSVSGGIIRLEEGTYTHASLSARATTDIPLEIEAVGSRAATVYQDAGASTFTSLPTRLLIRGITFKRTTSSNIGFLSGSSTTGTVDMCVFENCDCNLNGFGASGAYIQRLGRAWMINCGGDDMGIAQTIGTTFTAVNAIGSGEGSFDGLTVSAAGCKDLNGFFIHQGSTAPQQERVGGFCGYNFIGSTGATLINLTKNPGPAGCAVVGNVLEGRTGFVGPVVDVTMGAGPVENFVCMLNTVVGQRTNWLYLDTANGNNVKTGQDRFSVHRSFNMKGDIFEANGALVGNWSNINKVGYRANAYLRGSQSGTTPGIGAWLGEVAAFGEVSGSDASPLVTNWANDASLNGSGLGDGDYTPGSGHVLPQIPAGLAPYSHDQKGRPILNNGNGVAGAIQPV